ncbi:hypothetical protein NOC27_3067 [Nitrosococcus oceani AFC27]|nr:hypothetical protein NOC27_3067 [Nitrosococcus oceani AFC27]
MSRIGFTGLRKHHFEGIHPPFLLTPIHVGAVIAQQVNVADAPDGALLIPGVRRLL